LILIDNVVDNSPRLSDVNISTSRGAQQAVLITNKALEQINSFQAYAGASENRLQKSLDLISKNLETAKISRGRIIDSDFAVETTQLAVAQIIMQSSQSIILQANTAKQNLLTLIE
jgi:flagellin